MEALVITVCIGALTLTAVAPVIAEAVALSGKLNVSKAMMIAYVSGAATVSLAFVLGSIR